MKIFRFGWIVPSLTIGMVLLLALGSMAVAEDGGPPPRGKHAPPPEAYAACEGKQAGDSVTVTTPRGDKMTATCRELDGKLVATPNGPPPRPGERPGERPE